MVMMMMMMLTAQWDSNQTSGFRWWGLINVHQGLIESVFQEITKLYGLVYCPPLSLRLPWFLLDSSCKSLDKMCFCILNITNKNNNSFLFFSCRTFWLWRYVLVSFFNIKVGTFQAQSLWSELVMMWLKDIIDTGKTMKTLLQLLKQYNPKMVKVAR